MTIGRRRRRGGAAFHGNCILLTGEHPDLAREYWSGRIVSAMFFRHGSWLVCTQAHYRGTCRRFHGDVTDFRRVGWGRRIASMRPVSQGVGGAFNGLAA